MLDFNQNPWGIPELCSCEESQYLRMVISTLIAVDSGILTYLEESVGKFDKEIERLYTGMNYETYRAIVRENSPVQSGDTEMGTGGEG